MASNTKILTVPRGALRFPPKRRPNDVHKKYVCTESRSAADEFVWPRDESQFHATQSSGPADVFVLARDESVLARDE
jgi:hypothetical protein